ncbi:hypothetical protein CAEBREN_14500 [Caenorhabditis brenneri]|uniref:NTF2-like domain-containing protein n=1 Tax=Caenorhabditis brenneri TaxID=135651 RepID=G0NL78_CAEBE|nr:hypothetical protein CAEBREN_14500 [Caenorhabditis brenneri]
MFNRAAFLLLPALLLLVESLKINELVKHVGKRFEVETQNKPEDRCLYHLECQWAEMPDERVANIKRTDGNRIARSFAFSLAGDDFAGDTYEKSFGFIESIVHPDMTAKVCGHDKEMNAIQYIKHMKVMAMHNVMKPYRHYGWDFVETNQRDSMELKINVNMTDSMMGRVYLYFDIKLKIDVNSENEFSLFQITHINEYGTCGETGIVGYNTHISLNETEELRKKHVAQIFIDLITPTPYKDSADPGRLPMAWVDGLKEGQQLNIWTDEVHYTMHDKKMFQHWWKRFTLLWHPAKGEKEPMKLQTIDLQEHRMIARITLKLQAGRKEDEPVHEFEIKFSALEDPMNLKDPGWYANHVEVLCSQRFNMKEVSLRGMRDIITETFVDNIVKLPSPHHWYSSVEFVKTFTKTGTVELYHCDIRKTEVVTQIDLFEYDRNQKYNVKFLKYWIDEKDLELSATDTAVIRFRTKSTADTPNPEYTFEHLWEVTVKWDEPDQIYNIEKIEIGCSKHNFPGETEQDEDFNDFVGGLIGAGKK